VAQPARFGCFAWDVPARPWDVLLLPSLFIKPGAEKTIQVTHSFCGIRLRQPNPLNNPQDLCLYCFLLCRAVYLFENAQQSIMGEKAVQGKQKTAAGDSAAYERRRVSVLFLVRNLLFVL
jgi:hypothetical protein